MLTPSLSKLSALTEAQFNEMTNFESSDGGNQTDDEQQQQRRLEKQKQR